jgi:hypothetical protein
MKILHLVMRFYSYLATLGPAAFLTGMGLVAFISDQHAWKVDSFPWWKGQDLSIAFLILGVMGLAGTALAVTNWFRWLHPVMTIIYAGLFIYAFFWQSYRFAGTEEFQSVVAMAVGFVGSALSSLMEFKRGKK